jgi:acyl-CoA thioesterase I
MMPWPAYSIAGGCTFLPGVAFIVLAGLLGLLRPRRWLGYLAAGAVGLGIVLTAISAEALPAALYSIWAMVLLAWIFRGRLRLQRAKSIACAALLVVTVSARAVGIWYRILRSLPPGSAPRMYVIGDSISAPIGPHDVSTWSGLISAEHNVQVINLAHFGFMIADATKRLRSVRLSDGVVLIEIGGNDMIAKADTEKFADDLDKLARKLQGTGRTLVMLELPLFPLGNPYGLAQRQVAAKYHILLIPRRCFASVLAPQNATIDGIHLTPIGHRRMANLIWQVVGPQLQP